MFLDILEEFRDHTLEEWNFKALIKEQLESLLSQQKTYWQQRGAIKRVKFGDECTAFFHANASIRHRNNTITMIKDDNGSEVTDHEAKANLLWNSYKIRLGISEFSQMYVNLDSLLQPAADLNLLDTPFTREEIDIVIAEHQNNKSPGPDGFNGEFLKKCWPIIQQDFYQLCEAFHNGELCLQSINGSYFTLVPKNDSPTLVGDFRPISLLNSSIKLITKILAERLQRVIIGLIHKNQYGFIKSRTIQDCLAWAFEFLHLCKATKKELVILKLDLEKAFDKIEHEAILEILKHKGFSEKWIN